MFDAESEENRLVNTGTEKEQRKLPGIPFSKEALDELLEDVSKQRCEYIISQEGMRAVSVSKKDMQKATSFEKLYNLKSEVKID